MYILFAVPLLLLAFVGTMGLACLRMIAIRDGTQPRLEFDPNWASADQRAAELPDISQPLQGQR